MRSLQGRGRVGKRRHRDLTGSTPKQPYANADTMSTLNEEQLKKLKVWVTALPLHGKLADLLREWQTRAQDALPRSRPARHWDQARPHCPSAGTGSASDSYQCNRSCDECHPEYAVTLAQLSDPR